MRKFPVIFDTKARSIFLREDRLKLFMKTQVGHEPGRTNIYYPNDKPLRTIGSIKIYVRAGGMTEPVNFFVCKRLVVPAIFECVFCDQSVECIVSKTRFKGLTDVPTVPGVRHYGKQRSAFTNNTKVAGL